MKTRTLRTLGLVALTGILAACSGGSSSEGEDTAGALTDGQVERPPQFVLLAFDGSLNLGFWDESRQFARDVRAQIKQKQDDPATGADFKDNEFKFTYFISGTYFLKNSLAAKYHGPQHAAGKSDIGFGGDDIDALKQRLDNVRGANAEGHEMASHANGHFDGSSWSAADWDSEFDQFNKLIMGEGGQNMNGFPQPDLGISIAQGGNKPFDVIGFRAPLLGFSSGLYTTLKNRHFAYDTSKSTVSNYWPKKINDVWDFPLAQLKIVGNPQGKKTLSMDYNFYFAQSGGNAQPENKERFKKEMLDTYMAYFQSNYTGNRAPVNIGHHFSKWNGGAYWEAMKTFAQRVCALKEVRCATYRELTAFMEESSKNGNLEKYRAWTAANPTFEPMARQPGSEEPAEVMPAVPDSQLEAEGIARDHSAAHDEQ